ncbi:hypothetical protein F5I97DRAFT_1949824 [Phlebopus sp. FC_14]|nr:hypothetical protein F5I97DRAFT_1949824 [Phlebopus sp. FC_14]
MFSTAAALLLGLGTRIALDKFSGNVPDDPKVADSIKDIILLGVVQGVALYYALMEFPDFAFAVAFAIAARLALEFTILQDVSRCATTLLGVALGVLVTDVLSQLIEDGYLYSVGGDDRESEYGESRSQVKRRRLVKFQSTTEYSAVPPSKPIRPRKQDPERKWRTEYSAPPSITFSDSDLVDPDHTMSPLERKIALLRARASFADTERRRFKEEKKWALSQGNGARASQMSWQVKRHTALMQSFNKEADACLLERQYPVFALVVNQTKARQQAERVPLPTIQNAERQQMERYTNHPRQTTNTTSQEVFVERSSTVTLNVGKSHHRRHSSGNLKSAMRVQAR